MSKEIETTNDDVPQVSQTFSYWANLMQGGSLDVCRYPSQTSILGAGGGGWQCLEATQDPAPTVELLP